MSALDTQSSFVSPESLNELQEIFDLAWEEINAMVDRIGSENANDSRRKLAEAIMAARMDDPELIKQAALQEIRSRSINGRKQVA
jgi:hypothetical protein